MFYKDATNADGLKYSCKVCDSDAISKRHVLRKRQLLYNYTQTKVCGTCKCEKPINQFHKQPRRRDGLSKNCRECNNKVEVVRMRTKRSSKNYTKINIEYNKKYMSDKPELQRAHTATRKMPRLSGCVLHHWSYADSDVRDVVELTYSQHKMIHSILKYDQQRLVFVTAEGVVLDTRDKHLSFINNTLKVYGYEKSN